MIFDPARSTIIPVQQYFLNLLYIVDHIHEDTHTHTYIYIYIYIYIVSQEILLLRAHQN